MTIHILVIDIAKAKFDVALIVNDSYKMKVFSNNDDGFGFGFGLYGYD